MALSLKTADAPAGLGLICPLNWPAKKKSVRLPSSLRKTTAVVAGLPVEGLGSWGVGERREGGRARED